MSGRWVSLRPSQDHETRRIFGEWPSPIDRDATAKREIRFALLRWKAPLLPPLLQRAADNVALARISACSRIWSVPVPPGLRRQAQGLGRLERSPLVKTRRPPCAARSVGGSLSAAWLGPAICTLIRKGSGLRRHRPRRFVDEAAMTNAGSLAGTRRCACAGRPSWRTFAGCSPGCGPRRLRCRFTRITRKTLEPRPARGDTSRRRLATGAYSLAPQGRGSEPPPPSNVARS
jgi:hypothetical protein